ncbi:SulP family inorganic anion transporter [Magnetospira sp. QH-2]|uniref:SulP family inorganic anion transporter n=1 Tax=Magnetospira sp. (strain QH-2) TaxID=1288970 RepID=UPI0003E80F26|nr:SulP family inorganic anion transporter [Magnetospira sp. QH-2]CCQ72272.1 Putative Sulfate permease family protein [Magnetospira sp. QH-2]
MIFGWRGATLSGRERAFSRTKKTKIERAPMTVPRLTWQSFLPFLAWLPLVTRQTLRADLMAGLTGAVIVLPQGVAFAIIAGMPPEYGLYTAMVTPIVAALFGSSLHLISGPTTAISIVIFSTVSSHATPGSAEFVTLALTVTFLAGIYQLAFGLARLGILVNFVSHTVVVGFTAGAAILIATSQAKNVLGVHVPRGESFLHTWADIWQQIDQTNQAILIVALSTLVVAVAIKKLLPKLPNLLIALVVGALVAIALGGPEAGIATVGEIPAGLPPLSLPDLSISTIKLLAPEAFAVALLGLIEAVSISRAIAAKSHQRIDGNQEFIGQGASNLVGSFFSSYAGSGSFTRSGVNYSAGAQTPLSAIFAALFLLLILLLVAPLAAYLPMGAMAGVILVVAFNLIDTKQIWHVIESSKSETAILVATLGATLFLDLEFAIYLGVFLSLMIFLARTAHPEIVTLAPDYDPVFDKKKLTDVGSKPLTECPEMKILRIDMSIYFGSINQVQTAIQQVSEKEDIYHVLIIGTGINLIDLSGSEVLQQEAAHLEKMGGGLYFAQLNRNVYNTVSRTHLVKAMGNNHFFDEKQQAIRTLQRLLRKQGKCDTCPARVFEECRKEQAQAISVEAA